MPEGQFQSPQRS